MKLSVIVVGGVMFVVVVTAGVVGVKVLSKPAATASSLPVQSGTVGGQTTVKGYYPATTAPAPTPAPAASLPGWAQTAGGLLNLTSAAFNTGLGILKQLNP